MAHICGHHICVLNIDGSSDKHCNLFPTVGGVSPSSISNLAASSSAVSQIFATTSPTTVPSLLSSASTFIASRSTSLIDSSLKFTHLWQHLKTVRNALQIPIRNFKFCDSWHRYGHTWSVHHPDTSLAKAWGRVLILTHLLKWTDRARVELVEEPIVEEPIRLYVKNQGIMGPVPTMKDANAHHMLDFSNTKHTGRSHRAMGWERHQMQ